MERFPLHSWKMTLSVLSLTCVILSGPIVDIEECEDYILDEEQNKEASNVAEIPSEQNQNEPQKSEMVPHEFSERNG